MPVRILLIGAVVFLAAWFTILRPKPAAVDAPQLTQTTTTAPAATSTPETALGRAVAKAKAVAVATSTPAAAGTQTQTQTATTAATATPTPVPAVNVPAEELAKLPKDVAGALTSHKVLVLAVLSDEISKIRPLADDDRYVRNSLRQGQPL